jgi:hypothetical protein
MPPQGDFFWLNASKSVKYFEHASQEAEPLSAMEVNACDQGVE